jgi:hypothetical protein
LFRSKPASYPHLRCVVAILGSGLGSLSCRLGSGSGSLSCHLPSIQVEHGPYLGEDGKNDAFAVLMRLLASRIPHGYKPSASTMNSFSHKGWTCRRDTAPSMATVSWVANGKRRWCLRLSRKLASLQMFN